MTSFMKGAVVTATQTPSAAGTAAVDTHHARRWWILGVLALAQLMVVLDSTVVNIALPHAQSDLHFSNGDRQWIVTAYSLAFGSLLLLGGRLADIYGRKRVFLVGVIGFAGASAVGGASVDFGMLVAARAVQGAFGALLAPAALSLLTTTFTHPEERGKAFGIYGGIAAAGASVGLLLGGVLTQYLDWRWTMYVNVLIAVAATAGGVALLAPHARRAAPADRPHRHPACLRRHVRDRLRLRPRRHEVRERRLDRPPDARLPRRRRRAARRVRARGAAGRSIPCSRSASSPTATAAAPTARCSSPRSACSVSSCS